MALNNYTYQWRQFSLEAKRYYPAICHLCKVAIDTTLPHTDPYSWTLDHLDPVATYGNTVPDISRVRPAHRKCNSRRGKRAPIPSPRSQIW